MLFYVSITVRVPHGTDPELIERLRNAQEIGRAKELEEQGKMATRVARGRQNGRTSAYLTSKVTLSFTQILGSLPLYPYMEIEVTALCPMHPNCRVS